MKNVANIIILTTLLGFTSCLDDPDCVSTATDFVNIQFYSITSEETTSFQVNTVTAVNSDSIFFQDTTVSTIKLPLEVNSGLTTFAFDTELGVDTLSLAYDNRVRLVSEECGLELLFINLKLVRNDFDSVAVVNTSVATTLTEEVLEDVAIYN